MVKIVYFDYHGVLDRRHFAGLLETIAAAARRPDVPAVIATVKPSGYAYACGRMTPTDFWSAIAHDYGAAAATAGKKYILHVDPIREMWQLLNEIHPHIQLGLFSDCSLDKLAAIRNAYDLPTFFDSILFSCEAGVSKEDADFYQTMTQNQVYLPGECLLIDDNPDNVARAIASGFQAHVFSSPSECRQFLGTVVQKDPLVQEG
ncbi:MAG: HAD-IA family hydrolase [Candidatus Kerfeldbacteria bacterium]|nr:HAD-IA family hydrolase [Candidatus Kerfeldbacteria bacterium]